MSGFYKIIFLVSFCVAYTKLATGDSPYLECSYLDPVNCKLEFRAQFENALRIHMLELIKKLTTQSGDFIKEVLKKIPNAEIERREKLEQLVGLYDQSMQEAMENQNDTRKLFLTISGGTRFQNYSLSKLLGEEYAFQLDYKNLKEVDRFSDAIGNVWVELFDRLGEDDRKQFSTYGQITDEVKIMLEAEGLIKLELFKRLLRNIFQFLNMTDGK